MVDIFREADTMSPMPDTKPRRTRRIFTDDFKAGATRLVLDEGQTVAGAARDLGLTESSLRNWVELARADRTKGKTGLTTAEREELARLRKENRVLQEERDILKKAAAFFAKHSRGDSRSSRWRGPRMRLPSCVGVCRSRRVATTPGVAAQNRNGRGMTVG